MLIDKIGIAGAGTIGTGVAYVCAQHGFQTRVYDISAAAAQKCRTVAERLSAAEVQRGEMTQAQRTELLARLEMVDSPAALADCPLVIEAIPEDAAAKKALFAELDKLLLEEAILCTTSSGIPVTELAAVTNRPGLVAGLHFFAPVRRTKLVEVVRGLETDTITITFIRDICLDMGKIGIQSRKDTPGYIVNRMKSAMLREAVKIAQEEIAPPAEIDFALKVALGYPMGPFEQSDMEGVDESLRRMETLARELGPEYEPPLLLRRMAKSKRLGRKTGRGWHNYEE